MPTAVTVQNFDGEIITDLAATLSGATLSGNVIFQSVTVSTSEEQAKEVQFAGPTPKIVILYDGSDDAVGVDDERCVIVSLRLLIAGKVDPAVDEADRLHEILRLINLVKNAIEASPPDDANGFGDEDNFHPAGPVWADADISLTEDATTPWVAAVLPVTFGYGLTASTRH